MIYVDTNFADDLSLISDYLENTQLLLQWVVTAVVVLGSLINFKKTECTVNHRGENIRK